MVAISPTLSMIGIYLPSISLSHILTSPKMYEFIAGLGIAALLSFKFILRAKPTAIICAFALIFSALSFKFFDQRFFAKLALATCIVLLSALLNKYIKKNNIVQLLVRAGDYSYSTYLSHVFVIGIYLSIFGRNANAIMVVALITISLYLVSKLSFKYIEHNHVVISARRNPAPPQVACRE